MWIAWNLPARLVLRAAIALGLAASVAAERNAPAVAGSQAEPVCAPGVCEVPPAPAAGPVSPLPATPARANGVLLFFWGVGCPRCEQAKPFVRALAARHPELTIEWIEVRDDAAGRERLRTVLAERGAGAGGIPAFVAAGGLVVGYRGEPTEGEVRRLLGLEDGDPSAAAADAVRLPLFGQIRAGQMPFTLFTVLIGLADGFNPCALWVLLVLLGILSHGGSRRRMALVAGVFLAASAAVYFAFMAAWSVLFGLVGVSRAASQVLGATVLLLGLVNLKDAVWLKRGLSFSIPERARPGLYRRMRAVAQAASFPAALAGTALLALAVNLVELACTLGLPAVYTRLLSLRPDLGLAGRYAYLALYNAAYIVPLAVVVGAYLLLMRKVALGDRGARLLKGLSGALLLGFGLVLLLAPELLS